MRAYIGPLRYRPNNSTVDTQGSACCRRRLLRTDIDDQVCDFFSCREAIEQRGRAHCLQELLLGFLTRNALRLCIRLSPTTHDLRIRRPWKHRIDGDARSADLLGQAPGNGELGGLGHGVVYHVLGDGERRLAADEDNAPPAALRHVRHVVAGGANTAHDIKFEETDPLAVLNFEEGLRAPSTYIVDENVRIWRLRKQVCRAFRGRQICDDAGGACAPQPFCNGSTDACRGPSDDRLAASEIDNHDTIPLNCERAGCG